MEPLANGRTASTLWVMTNREAILWDQIRGFDIDGGPAKLTFTQRLARENQWPLEYAEAVVYEYRRFLFLAMVAGHPVTPSDEVDQAWHLHLLYVDSYWNRLVKDVLPHPLEHGPTKGGAAERAKYFDWYAKTLEAYRKWFGEEPPHGIWPAPAARFDHLYARINLKTSYVVPKRLIRRLTTFAGMALAVLLPGLLIWANPDMRTSQRIALLFLAGVGIVIGAGILSQLDQPPTQKKNDAGGCSGGGGCGSSPDGGCGSDGGAGGCGGCGGCGG